MMLKLKISMNFRELFYKILDVIRAFMATAHLFAFVLLVVDRSQY